MLVGLTGRYASGKTTVVQWFANRGVQTMSCSDSIRRWLSEEGIEESRDSLIEGGRELRRRGGAGILAEMLLDELSGGDAVIDSIRTPSEVEALRVREDFVLIEILAGIDSRWQRSQERARPGDPSDKATFISQEKSEEVALDAAGQALVATAEMADLVLYNNGSIEDLHSDLEDLVERFT
ncbi:MAG: dephospho-CoA kinase [Candidatus Poseidoniales archaeon]|nr:MAG: dephospho-CoA kinase [Candidatus Poseidoniales archaeon]